MSRLQKNRLQIFPAAPTTTATANNTNNTNNTSVNSCSDLVFWLNWTYVMQVT